MKKAMKEKRKLSRRNLPLVIEFRPTYGAKEYTPGLVKNISFRGITVESLFPFLLYENLDLRLRFPQSSTLICMNGDVIWKKQTGEIYLAGIQFKKTDHSVQNILGREIASCAIIPLTACLRGDNRQEGPRNKGIPEQEFCREAGHEDARPANRLLSSCQSRIFSACA